jgi:Ca2+-binding RTX toxin-like protein
MADFFGTQRRDTIPGTDVDDYIQGWLANGNASTDVGDQLFWLGGNDYLTGGGGRDTLSLPNGVG